MKSKKWNEQVFLLIAPLRIKISECLRSNNNNTEACNDFSDAKLGKYHAVIPHITHQDIQSVSIRKDAGIRVVGGKSFGSCILNFISTNDGGFICTMEAQSGGDSLKECRSYIYIYKCRF